MCRGTFPWDERRWNQDVLAWTKTLIRLKKNVPALRRGGLQPLQVSEELLAYKRLYEGEEVWVYTALKPTEVQLPLAESLLTGQRVAGSVRLSGLGLFRLLH
jgi:alpha-glucosidase